MEEHRVLFVGFDPADVERFEASVSDDGPSVCVRTLDSLGELYEVLTKDVVHCLVLTPTVEGTGAIRIVRGVRGLFPDLPIVLAGRPDDSVPGNLDLTVVDVDSTPEGTVADAVETAIDGGVDSDAGRPPSRMETLLLSMFHGLPVHLYAKDEAARHLITSNTTETGADLIGLTDLDYTELPEDHRKAAYRDDMSVIEGDGKRVEVEEYTDYIDSHTLTSKVPWYDGHDELVGLVGLTRDITERKKREQASRRQHELLVKVALVAAHELRNELQVAAGRLELLDEESDQIDVIADSQRQLSRIVDKVVELASEERPGRSPEGLWLSTLSREVWDTLEVGDATLTIAQDVHFVADRESTSLFLQIVLKNAIQHGGSDVTVTVGTLEDGVYVADDGPGIDVEPVDRVFDAGYTTDPGSTGFGLYVARSIADEHGWTITIAESDGGGARFEIHGPTAEKPARDSIEGSDDPWVE